MLAQCSMCDNDMCSPGPLPFILYQITIQYSVNIHVASGIHIPSQLVILDNYNLVRTIKITSKVALPTSEVLLNHKIIRKFLYDFIHFPHVLIISHLLKLKMFRIIIENNKQLLSAMK